MLISEIIFQYSCSKFSIVTFIYIKKYNFKIAIRRYVYALHIDLIKRNYMHIILQTYISILLCLHKICTGKSEVPWF
jgi:hypothetical protein